MYKERIEKIIVKILNNKYLLLFISKIRNIKKFLWLFIKYFYYKVSSKILFNNNEIFYTGTGGDNKNDFNISTTVSLILSLNGIKIVKLGSKKRTSKSGSIDLFNLYYKNYNNKNYNNKYKLFKKSNIIIFTIKDILPLNSIYNNLNTIRKELQCSTILNYIFPLLNVFGIRKHILGINNPSLGKYVCKIMIRLGIKEGIVISSMDNSDELSIFNNNIIYRFKNNKVYKLILSAKYFNLDLPNRYIKYIKINSINDSKNIILNALKKINIPALNTIILNLSCIINFITNKKYCKCINKAIDYINNNKVINFFLNDKGNNKE